MSVCSVFKYKIPENIPLFQQFCETRFTKWPFSTFIFFSKFLNSEFVPRNWRGNTMRGVDVFLRKEQDMKGNARGAEQMINK